MKKFLFGSLLFFIGLSSYSQQMQYTVAERLEINSNSNFESVNNNSARVDLSSVDKNLQGEIKDELSGMTGKFIILNLNESTNELQLRWNNQFSTTELIDVLAHFGLTDTSIIHPWQ